jgi:hypothetical protein
VQCALKWAFIPEGGFNGQGQRFSDAFDESVPGQWKAWAGNLHFPAMSGAGCEGPAVPTGVLGTGTANFPALLPGTIHPFDACSGVMQKAAQTSNAICTAVILFFGGLKVLRVVLRAFGMYVPESRDPWRPVNEPELQLDHEAAKDGRMKWR